MADKEVVKGQMPDEERKKKLVEIHKALKARKNK